MEDYLIFAAIGGLILLTLFVNSVAEAWEQKQREKRLKILAIKRGLDNISDLLERLQGCNIGEEIRELLLNEIMARIEMIQRIDRNFRGVEALIEEAGDVQEKNKTPPPPDNYTIKDEKDFNSRMRAIGLLIRQLNTGFWYSKVKSQKLYEYIKSLKVLRCEMIFQFYSDKANRESQQHKYLVAQENYHYILHALKSSGVSDHPRIAELTEQAEFMLKKTSSDLSRYMSERTTQSRNETEQDQEENDNGQESAESDTELPKQESPGNGAENGAGT